MTEAEFNKLIDSVESNKLDIKKLISKDYIEKLFEESGGHPYVAKILLGVVAMEKKAGDITRIVAGQDEMLTALFERTYSMLTTAAKKVLTLASWQSTIPKIGIEAVITKTAETKMKVEEAINELYKFSFIDIISKSDHSKFISLPLSAYLFGQNKLSVSTFKQQVNQDESLLMMFGVGKVGEVDDGIHLRLEKFFQQVAIRVTTIEVKK